MKAIATLIKKEILLEWRQKHMLFGVALYVGCTVFVLYMMAGQPESRIWNALFWVAQLFVTVNAVAKSFLQESEERNRYYHTLTGPVPFVLSKLIYSLGMMLVITLLTLALFRVLLGNPIIHFGVFVGVSCVGGSCLSLLFTFLSAIAAQARQNAALMAIMGFPIAIPLLMILSRLTLSSVSPVLQEGWWGLLATMAAMGLLITALSILLFPLLWEE